MHETIHEASPSSKEPMRKRWQIAWVHNGNAGGSKRFAYEMVRNLSARGHVIDEFITAPELRERLGRGATELAHEWFSCERALDRTMQALQKS